MSAPAPGAPVALRLGTAADADAAAALHATWITEGFLASLGVGFLHRLYRRVARSPDSFLLVAEAGGGPAGFLAGTLDLRALYRRFLLRDGVVAAAAAAPRLARAWPRAWETLRHGATGAGGAPGPELLAMAVDPAWRGRGVGRLLVEGFLAELGRRGTDHARVVVGGDNTAALALYGQAGFTAVEHFELHRGTVSVLMRWSA